MATSRESFEHGEHNEAACAMLEVTKKFPDWTITTAFYASLHFVSSKIFPFEHPIKDQKPLKIQDIVAWQKFKNYNSAKRHELLKDLTGVYCTEVA